VCVFGIFGLTGAQLTEGRGGGISTRGWTIRPVLDSHRRFKWWESKATRYVDSLGLIQHVTCTAANFACQTPVGARKRLEGYYNILL